MSSEEREYIINVIDAEVEENKCSYEGDIPWVDLKLSVKQMTLTELLKSLSDDQLADAGLQRIPKKK